MSYEKAERQTTLMLWDGNRQIQEYTKDYVFTTIYNENSFEPVARIVQLSAENEKQRVAEGVAHVRKYVPSGIITQEVLDNIEKAKIPLVKIYHYHCNHLGTPQELSDDKGDIVWLSYDRAWGECYDKFYKAQAVDSYEILAEQLQPFKFQGQFFDVETGFHYNRFRYYDSDVGMFVSRDPIELLGGFNVFAYAPNPTGWVDPFGLNKQSNCSIFSFRRLPKDPNDIPKLFPNVLHMAKNIKPDKIEYSFKYKGIGYIIEFHKDHGDPTEHFDGDHYHIKKVSSIIKPPKTTPNIFRLKNTDPATRAILGGGTFAAGDLFPQELRC